MMGSSRELRSNFPFTANQWHELEQQAMIYSYMVAGIPIPPHLLYSSKVIFPDHQKPGPGRCRRTDGKKWRCSREACPDSRYCERHLHRAIKNRSTNLTSSSSSNHFSLYSTTPQFLFDSTSSSTRDSSVMNQEPQRKTTTTTTHCFFDDSSTAQLSISANHGSCLQ